MKRLLILFAMASLSACLPGHKRCMNENEVGTVVGSKTVAGQFCERTSGCENWQYATVTVRMANGVTRVCKIDDVSAGLLEPGTKVNLSVGYRLY
jgi:hypothetical protein